MRVKLIFLLLLFGVCSLAKREKGHPKKGFDPLHPHRDRNPAPNRDREPNRDQGQDRDLPSAASTSAASSTPAASSTSRFGQGFVRSEGGNIRHESAFANLGHNNPSRQSGSAEGVASSGGGSGGSGGSGSSGDRLNSESAFANLHTDDGRDSAAFNRNLFSGSTIYGSSEGAGSSGSVLAGPASSEISGSSSSSSNVPGARNKNVRFHPYRAAAGSESREYLGLREQNELLKNKDRIEEGSISPSAWHTPQSGSHQQSGAATSTNPSSASAGISQSQSHQPSNPIQSTAGASASHASTSASAGQSQPLHPTVSQAAVTEPSTIDTSWIKTEPSSPMREDAEYHDISSSPVRTGSIVQAPRVQQPQHPQQLQPQASQDGQENRDEPEVIDLTNSPASQKRHKRGAFPLKVLKP